MADNILWVYIVLLVAGGLVGFLKAGSKMSLIMSVAFAVPLALSLLLKWPVVVGYFLLGFLFAFFGIRFTKSKKFMPNGLMMILSLVTLVLRIVLK